MMVFGGSISRLKLELRFESSSTHWLLASLALGATGWMGRERDETDQLIERRAMKAAVAVHEGWRQWCGGRRTWRLVWRMIRPGRRLYSALDQCLPIFSMLSNSNGAPRWEIDREPTRTLCTGLGVLLLPRFGQIKHEAIRSHHLPH